MMLYLNTLLWFMFISVVSAMSPDDMETNRIMEEMERVKSLHLGFLHPPLIKKFNNYEAKVYKAQKRTEFIYKQLQCSYALFGARYMRLIEGLLADPNYKLQGNLTQILFDEEAAAMLAASMNVPGLKEVENLLWTFWLYADRLHRFLNSITILDVTDEQHRLAILKVHNVVYDVLDRFLNAPGCLLYSVDEKLHLLTNEIIMTTYEIDNTKSLVELLANNKSMFNEQKIINNELGILTIGEKQFSMKTLSLNGLLGIKTIAYQSLGADFWTTVKYGPSYEYNSAMGLGVKLTDQVNSLLVFQKQYIDVLKVIALHLGKHFLMATTNAVRLGKDSLQERKEKVMAELTKLEFLINFIRERSDDTIHFIICCVESCIIDRHGVPRNTGVEDLENKITHVLSKSITTNTLTKFSIKKYEKNTEDPDEFHASIVEQFDLVVKNAIKMLSDINFSVVNSFIAYTSSDECRQVTASENITTV